MSIHKSLVPASALRRHRNVLTRDERIALLSKDGRFNEGQSIFGLGKVRNIMMKAKAKKKEEAAEGAAAAPAAAGATAAAAGAKAPAAAKAPAGKADAKAPAAAPAKKDEKKK